MPQITFNLSKTSRSPGWDPHSAFHDDLWDTFAAGYAYRVAGGDGTVFDSLRGSDPATRGTSDTFQSSAGSLDLTAHNFAGNVSLDWFGEVAQLTLDSAWNTIKNAYVSDFSGYELVLKNWVDVWVALDNSFDQEVFVDGAKRAEISTGSGNDVIFVGVDSNGAGWTNHIKIDSGDGNDHITVALATRDYSGSAFAAAYNPAWTTTEINGGTGDDVIEGGKSTDVIDGGAGKDTVVLHGDRADYSVSTNSDITTIVDLWPSAEHDGTDHLTMWKFCNLTIAVSPRRSGCPHRADSIQTTRSRPVAPLFSIVIADPMPPATLVGLADPAGGATVPLRSPCSKVRRQPLFRQLRKAWTSLSRAGGAATYSSAVDLGHPSPVSVRRVDCLHGHQYRWDNDIAFVAHGYSGTNDRVRWHWSNGAFQHPEDHWSTTPSNGVAAGTVITIDHIHSSGSISTNIGTVAGSGDLTGHDEAVFAYLSEITPSGLERHFLTGISNSTFQASGSNLAGTDLAPGVNALEFGNHVDIAEYFGSKTTPHSAEYYLAQLTAPENWISQSGSGDQSHDGVLPNAPFHVTHFELLV